MAINMSVVFYDLISVCYMYSTVLASASSTSQVVLCPGDVLTTECAIMGGGATVWQGTTFQCDRGNHREVILRHSQFRGSYDPIDCNNGAIVVQALGIINSSYISQLNVTVSPELNNTAVECWHDYNLTARIIRSIQITVLATSKQENVNVKPPMYM